MGFASVRSQRVAHRRVSREWLLEPVEVLRNDPHTPPVPPRNPQEPFTSTKETRTAHRVQRVVTVPLSRTVVLDPFCFASPPLTKHHSAHPSTSLTHANKASKQLSPLVILPSNKRNLSYSSLQSVLNPQSVESPCFVSCIPLGFAQLQRSPHQASIDSRPQAFDQRRRPLLSPLTRAFDSLAQKRASVSSAPASLHLDNASEHRTKALSETTESLLSLYGQLPSTSDLVSLESIRRSRDFDLPQTPPLVGSRASSLDIIDFYAELDQGLEPTRHSKALLQQTYLAQPSSVPAISLTSVRMSFSEASEAAGSPSEAHHTPTRHIFDDLPTAFISITSKSMRNISPISQVTPTNVSSLPLPPATAYHPADEQLRDSSGSQKIESERSVSYHYLPAQYRHDDYARSKSVAVKPSAETINSESSSTTQRKSVAGKASAETIGSLSSSTTQTKSVVEKISTETIGSLPNTHVQSEDRNDAYRVANRLPSVPSALSVISEATSSVDLDSTIPRICSASSLSDRRLIPAALRISKTTTTGVTEYGCVNADQNLSRFSDDTMAEKVSLAKRVTNKLQSTMQSVANCRLDAASSLSDLLESYNRSFSRMIHENKSSSAIGEPDLERGLPSSPSLGVLDVGPNLMDGGFGPMMEIPTGNYMDSIAVRPLPIGPVAGTSASLASGLSHTSYPSIEAFPLSSEPSIEYGLCEDAGHLDEHAYLSEVVNVSSDSITNTFNATSANEPSDHTSGAHSGNLIASSGVLPYTLRPGQSRVLAESLRNPNASGILSDEELSAMLHEPSSSGTSVSTESHDGSLSPPPEDCQSGLDRSLAELTSDADLASLAPDNMQVPQFGRNSVLLGSRKMSRTLEQRSLEAFKHSREESEEIGYRQDSIPRIEDEDEPDIETKAKHRERAWSLLHGYHVDGNDADSDWQTVAGSLQSSFPEEDLSAAIPEFGFAGYPRGLPVHPGRGSRQHVYQVRRFANSEQQILIPNYEFETGSGFPNRNALTGPAATVRHIGYSAPSAPQLTYATLAATTPASGGLSTPVIERSSPAVASSSSAVASSSRAIPGSSSAVGRSSRTTPGSSPSFGSSPSVIASSSFPHGSSPFAYAGSRSPFGSSPPVIARSSSALRSLPREDEWIYEDDPNARVFQIIKSPSRRRTKGWKDAKGKGKCPPLVWERSSLSVVPERESENSNHSDNSLDGGSWSDISDDGSRPAARSGLDLTSEDIPATPVNHSEEPGPSPRTNDYHRYLMKTLRKNDRRQGSTPLTLRNSFGKFMVVGADANITGTPDGTGMRDAGSSLVGTSPADSHQTNEATPRNAGEFSFDASGVISASSSSPFPTEDLFGYYLPSPLAFKSKLFKDESAEEINRRSEEERSKMYAASHMDDYVTRDKSGQLVPLHGRPTSKHEDDITAATNSHLFDPKNDTIRPESPKSTALRSVILPFEPVEKSFSPHLLRAPRRRSPAEISERLARKKKISWIWFAVCCILPPLLILYGHGGFDCLMGLSSGGHIAKMYSPAKRAAKYTGYGFSTVAVVCLSMFWVVIKVEPNNLP